ncbi:unnamed protein product [Adineta ricciae]|uniref:NAD(+) diphosphatase n=1 Tax=Adineta ricciae TaxID=249248 RepID=A0A813XWZ1_ADIRI|nr:unnamed protein product [Adineta ricciae]
MQQFIKSYLRRLKVMALRPEIHFSSVFEHCAANKHFQSFQGNPLNHLNIHRKSIEDVVRHPQSRFLTYRQLKVLFNPEKKQPVWLTYRNLFESDTEPKLTVDQCEVVLLGIGSRLIVDRPSLLKNTEETKIDHKLLSKYLLESEPTPDEYIYFALSIPTQFADNLTGTYIDLRSLLPQLSVIDAALCGQGRALLEWHASYQYCGKCGSPSKSLEDPVAITLVIHSDNEHVLLGRKASFPPFMYTCLAGFMEPGESIPEACSREIWEESGIIIDTNTVRYFDSQPWPFLGGQLMIGCYASAVDETITLHDSELEDCQWFSRADVAEMIQRARNINLDKNDQGLRIPPPIAIAHQLISNWFSTTTSKT